MKRIGGYLALAIILVVIAVILLSQSRRQPIVATPLPSETASSSPTPVASATPTFTQTATPTETPTASLTLTSTQEETATVIPTATDEPPTATMTSTADSRVLIRVVAQVAVFRDGPGRVYPTVAQVKMGNKILLSGISADRVWYMFIYNDQDTWISGDKLVTEVIFGDVNSLPVIDAPPVPSPRPTSSGGDGGYNIATCDFYNNMSPETQDSMLQQVYDAVNANDWHQAGTLARHLYQCPAQATFYLLYNVYVPSHPGLVAADAQTAFTLFQQGWSGR
jgi:hypothetical protein